MRLIGKLPLELAPEPFHDHLLALGVQSRIDAGADGRPVWILNEDQVEQARGELTLYLADPQNPRYQTAKTVAQTVRRRQRSLDKAYQKNFRDAADLWSGPRLRQRPLTIALIAISCVVFLLEHTDSTGWVRERLSLATLADVRSGEVWRLVTPIFMHVSLLHIFFNMSALNVLGTMIEFRRGSGRLLILVVASAVISNLGQYCYMERANPGMPHLFEGMSGAVYGLFGYIWMKGIHEPEQGLILHPNSVAIMIGWLFLCMTGALGPIANAAHVTGMVAGMVLGLMRF